MIAQGQFRRRSVVQRCLIALQQNSLHNRPGPVPQAAQLRPRQPDASGRRAGGRAHAVLGAPSRYPMAERVGELLPGASLTQFRGSHREAGGAQEAQGSAGFWRWRSICTHTKKKLPTTLHSSEFLCIRRHLALPWHNPMRGCGMTGCTARLASFYFAAA